MPKRILFIALGFAVAVFLLYLGLTGRQNQPAAVSSAIGPDTPQGQTDSTVYTGAGPSAGQLPVRNENVLPVAGGQPATDRSPVADSPVSVPTHAQPPPALEPEIRRALGRILNTSSEGLVEETRDGVTKVDLQRRFQTAPVATVDEQGNVEITDYTHLPPEPVEPAQP